MVLNKMKYYAPFDKVVHIICLKLGSCIYEYGIRTFMCWVNMYSKSNINI